MIRNVAQSFIVWAESNHGSYPLPSSIDTDNKTIASELGRAKDTTANIESILIFNGLLSPEISISSRESNPSIQVDVDYQFERPGAAADPANALWDPAFSADFTNGRTGNTSFALLQPSGQSPESGRPERTGRLRMWQDTFSTTEPIASNRGPEIASVGVAGDGSRPSHYTVKPRDRNSLTFKIHGSGSKWLGNVAFNDGHTELVRGLAPARAAGDQGSWPTYPAPAGPRLDTLFYDEPDDPARANAYLGIFTTAGENPEDFKAIWD